MLDPRVLPLRDKGPVNGNLVLTRLAHATIELEDQATEAEPSTVSLRIGDDNTGVLLQGDLRTVHRLIVEADRQLTYLHHHRQSARP
jgi:hypothetical protein